MDQRTQGGPTTPPPLPATAPSGEREKEGVGGKKEEEEEKRKKEREGAKSEPGVGTEGAPGDQSQQQQQHKYIKASKRSSNCSHLLRPFVSVTLTGVVRQNLKGWIYLLSATVLFSQVLSQ